MKYLISYGCVSSPGKLRSVNQDNFICGGRFMESGSAGAQFRGSVDSRERPLFGVFDGLGGEECGEIAALIAAECAAGLQISRNPAEDLAAFCQVANREICGYAEKNGVFSMGTTAAMLSFTEAGITLCNIGDSRVFRYSGGDLRQISRDHIAGAPYGRKPPLSQNLGIPADELILEPYLARGSYRRGDVYLICSDGLTDMVSEESIAGVLGSVSAEEAAGVLAQMALDNGGRDNVTVIVCGVGKAPGVIARMMSAGKT